MRQIKFRAWDKIDSIISETCDFNPIWVSIPRMDEDGGHLEQRKMEDIELMQFTGLLDKNGKEIYEGDILKTLAGTKGEIEFKFFMWTFYNTHLNNWGGSKGLEVIGNIYENPELMK